MATIFAWITGIGAGLCLLCGLILFIVGAVVDGAAATVVLARALAFGAERFASPAFAPSFLAPGESQALADQEGEGKKGDGKDGDGSADPSAGFFDLIKRAFGIVFYRGSTPYRRGQRLMAAGLVLICLALAFFIIFVPALITAMAASGGSSGTPTPSSSSAVTATAAPSG